MRRSLQTHRQPRNRGALHRPQQITHGFRRDQKLLWQAYVKDMLEARQQLHPAEAIQTQVPLQGTVQGR